MLSETPEAAVAQFTLPDLVQRISARRPNHAKFLRAAVSMLDKEELAEADTYISQLMIQYTPQFMVESYETILDDTMKSQLFFLKEGRYPHSKFFEVENAVYGNENYMKRYMIGLAVSNFLWPNHTKLRRFFVETFPWARAGTYLEVGPGHGLFMVKAMQNPHLDRFVGVDISDASLTLTAQAIRCLSPAAERRLRLIKTDFLTADDIGGDYDVVVMGEVLEHVEQPLEFLSRLRSVAARDAHVFVTTCVNAPAIDHISLFRTEGEVEVLLMAAGFKITQQLSVPVPGKTLAQCVAATLPINVAYVLAP